jgi:hypothetical protein
MNWNTADSQLRKLWNVYSNSGVTGVLYRDSILRPLRDRLHSGERSVALYGDILKLDSPTDSPVQFLPPVVPGGEALASAGFTR